MKPYFKKAMKVFKYLFVLFSMVFWIGIVIDDYVFIEKYWKTKWLQYLGIWMLFYLVYLLFFSILYWMLSGVGIFVYCRFFTKKEKANTSD